MHWMVRLEGGPRRVNHAAVRLGDWIYSFGGYCSNENPSPDSPIDIHRLNCTSYRWRQVHSANETLGEKCVPAENMEDDDPHRHDVPYQRYGHTVVAFGGKAYLWGGRNDEFGASSALHEYNPRTNTWCLVEAKGNPPAARDGHSALVYKDWMIIFGGFEEETQRFSQETFIYNFLTQEWKDLACGGVVPNWRDFHTAAVLEDNMYIFGGRSDVMGQFHSTNDEYDTKLRVLNLKTSQWSVVESTGQAPDGRRSHSAWTYKGCMYIFGGYDGKKNVHFNDLFVFNPAKNNEWTKLTPRGAMPSERRRQCTVEANGRVFLFGGTMPHGAAKTTSALAGQTNAVINQGLSDLADLYVLDYQPSLYHLCARTVIEKLTVGTHYYALPREISYDLENMTSNNSVMVSTTKREREG